MAVSLLFILIIYRMETGALQCTNSPHLGPTTIFFPLLAINSFYLWNMWSTVLCTLWNRLVDLPTQHLAENFQSVPSCLRLQGWRENCRKTKEDSHHGACRWSSALPLSHLSHRHPLWLEVAESPHKHETAGGPEVATATGQSDNEISSLKTACFAN